MVHACGVRQQMMKRDPLPQPRAAGKPPCHRLGQVELPFSASSMAAAAANCLLTEAIWNRVRGVHFAQAPASASARHLHLDAASARDNRRSAAALDRVHVASLAAPGLTQHLLRPGSGVGSPGLPDLRP